MIFKKLRILIVIFSSITSLTFSSSGYSVCPPDSITSVVDKTAALYLIEEGKDFYLKGKIRSALLKFREASVKDPNSWKAPYWISKCHYDLKNYGYAKKYILKSKSINPKKVDEEIYYLMGQIYHRLGSVDTALINYQLAKKELKRRRAKELNIDQRIVECNFAKVEMEKGMKYQRNRLKGDINSGYDDYGALLIGNGDVIYFTSRRSDTKGGGINPDDDRYFEDIYRSKYNKNKGEWTAVSNDVGKINTKGFDAINYISADTLWGVMTLNLTAVDSDKQTKGSDLCIVKMSDKGKWNSPRIINNKTINTSYFEGAATLTEDGNTMYFVSDRQGDKSSTDIYVVEKIGANSWGEAKRLPDNINTKWKETTPFITPDGRFLFFSSTGHKGMGGFDVFVVENLGDNEWSDPVNLGYGINTVNDDTHFSIYPKLKKGLVSGVEIIKNKATIDIYELNLDGLDLEKLLKAKK